jgi:hypothetical protein
MRIELYSFKRKAEASRKLKIEYDDRVHWIIAFPDIKKSYCSLCLYQDCIHGQSFINSNVGSIFMEHMDFKQRYVLDIDTTEEKTFDIGFQLMSFLSQNPAMRKNQILKIIDDNK